VTTLPQYPQPPAPAFLFDLDGTLIDSVYQHVIAWRTALARLDIDLSVWRIHRRIGMSGGLFVSALLRETGRTLSGDDIATMAGKAIVFALANPDPEVDPDAASRYAAVVATGRSDYPNQINNVLAFPGVFRGLLDAQSRLVTDNMLIAAAQALADVVSPDEIGPHYIIPSVFHPDVASSVAAAVRDAATADMGTAGLDR